MISLFRAQAARFLIPSIWKIYFSYETISLENQIKRRKFIWKDLL